MRPQTAPCLLTAALLLGSSACSDPAAETAPPTDLPPPCTPRSPSLDDPFAVERDPSSTEVALAEAIAQRYMTEHEPESMAWDWGEATLMLGFVDLYRVTAEPSYRDYYQRWIDHHIDVGYEHLITMSDRCPPALSALALYQETCTPAYRRVVEEVLTYLYEEAARTEQGGISHLGTSPIFAPSLWLDSLFMFGNVLTRWGVYADDASALDEYATQFGIFAELLQHDSGLYQHAYNWELTHDDDVYWARGNGWVTTATYEYLRVRAERGEADAPTRSAIEQQVDAIIDTQDPATGLWWTVMDRPGETYLETSATALFALGLARGYRDGLLDAAVLPTIELAMTGVQSRIELDGQGRPVVTGTSGPTTVTTFDKYATIELIDDLHYGVGAVILALLETSGL